MTRTPCCPLVRGTRGWRIPLTAVDGGGSQWPAMSRTLPPSRAGRCAGNAEPAVLVGGPLIGGSGLVADERRARGEGERLQAAVDDRAVLGRAAHHRRPHEKARPEGLGRGAVAVEVAAIVRIHKDVGAALHFGMDAGRGFALEDTGAGTHRAFDTVARQQVVGAPPGLIGGPGGGLAALAAIKADAASDTRSSKRHRRWVSSRSSLSAWSGGARRSGIGHVEDDHVKASMKMRR